MKYLTWKECDSLIGAGWKEIDKLPFDLPKDCIIITASGDKLSQESIFTTDASGIVIDIDPKQKSLWIMIDNDLLYQMKFDDYAEMSNIIGQMIGNKDYAITITA